MRWRRLFRVGLAVASFLFVGGLGRTAEGPASKVVLEEAEEGIEVRVGGKLFTVYRSDVEGTPVFYPVIGPSGENLTRHYPMVEGVEGEETDHPHHRSIWFGHRDVNGQSFWSVGKGAAQVKQKNLRLIEADSANGVATITVENDWATGDGEAMASDEREYRIRGLGGGEVRLDYVVRIKASEGVDLVFGNQKDGVMAVRVAPWMKLADRKGVAKGGSIVNSEGVEGKDAWGKRADWVDYYGTSPEGVVCGIAMFDHPDNLRHPTWWHARYYGLLSANPFGQGDFEAGKVPEDAGNYTLKAGEELVLAYGFYFHRGTAAEAGVAEQYAIFAEAPQ